MPHHRARFTARGRWDVARRVVEDGETFAQGYALAMPAAAWPELLPGAAAAAAAPVEMGVRVAGASRSAGAWSALLAELADHLDGVETVAELRSVGRRAARLLDADDVAIMRVTGDGRLVELLSDHSVNHAGSRWLLEDFPATRHLIERGEVGQIVAGDDAVDPVEQEELTGLGFQAMLIVPAPLGAAGSALIEVYRVRPRAFTRAEIERARVVALQLRAVLVRL